jgi:demethylmenaquinone methyltransferase/2-methoxy-6-polyprenyl-1,4-benzoquinol methylase
MTEIDRPEPPAPTRPHDTLREYYGADEARQGYINTLFDDTAQHYDWICRAMSLGSGQMYRKMTLERVGLQPGMRLLDVATGTGLVARSALDILGRPSAVVGLDPSQGMLRECRRLLPVSLVKGRGEILPCRDGTFDRLSMGYALRHVPDLLTTFREYRRVLKAGGQVLILEITRPRSAVGRFFVGLYLKQIVPLVARLGTRSPKAQTLMRYYWDTIDHCVSPEVILDTLTRAGFAAVDRLVMGGILSEYRGTKA